MEDQTGVIATPSRSRARMETPASSPTSPVAHNAYTEEASCKKAPLNMDA